MRRPEHLRHIVVEGPIGVGKTTLARRLAKSFDSELLLEEEVVNPFLPRFYRDRKAHALATQLYFLLERARQLQELRQADLFAPVRVADFLIEKDRLFAQLTLDQDELSLYDQIYARLTLDAPRPDLVIYLQAPVNVLLRRVASRGIDYERGIEADYLARLADAYTEFFFHYDDAPLLIVNAQDIDLASSEEDYNLLLEQLPQVRSGRRYFNPTAL